MLNTSHNDLSESSPSTCKMGTNLSPFFTGGNQSRERVNNSQKATQLVNAELKCKPVS